MHSAGLAMLRRATAVSVVTALYAVGTTSALALQRSGLEAAVPRAATDDRSVGGQHDEALVDRLERAANTRLHSQIRVSAGDAWLQTDRAELGVIIDVDAAIDAAWVHGRLRLWTAPGHHLSARGGPAPDVELSERLDLRRFQRWSEAAAEELSRAPQPAQLRLEVGGDGESLAIEVIDAVEGQYVTAEDVAAAVRAELAEPGRRDVEVAAERILAPAVTGRDLATVHERARMAVSAPVTMVGAADGADLILPPEELARMLEIVRDDSAPEGERLRLVVDPARLPAELGGESVAAARLGDARSRHLTEISAQLLGLLAQPAPRLMELQPLPAVDQRGWLGAAEPV